MNLKKPAKEKDCNFLPYSLLETLLHQLGALRNVQVLTYADLEFPEASTYRDNYLAEWSLWKERLARSRAMQKTIFVFLQHDVDRYPSRTHKFLQDQVDAGIRSNVMVFNRMIDRAALKAEGRVIYKEYPLNWPFFRELETGHGFVFGYHSNAYEQALFDLAAGQQIFFRDISELRARLSIHHFSPHGGNRDANGNSNSFLEPPKELEASLRWVQNGHSIRFDGYYSDGGINGMSRDPRKRDLRDFMASLQAGGRYRILIHPQYYADEIAPTDRLLTAPWYVQLLEHHAKGTVERWWADGLYENSSRW